MREAVYRQAKNAVHCFVFLARYWNTMTEKQYRFSHGGVDVFILHETKK